MRTLAAGILALLALPAPAGADQPARVDLSLERYEELRKAPEPPVSATVVEEARFSGSFAERGLVLTLAGRSLGKRPEVPLFSEVDGFALHGCDGGVLVRRSGAGTLALVPLAERFHATCRVALEPGRERITFVAALAVLHVAAALPNGRMEYGEEGEEGSSVALLRLVSSREHLPVTATGRYRITLLPDEVAFRYELALHNPNRERALFALPLANGERVERTEPVAGDEADGAWRLEVPPGDSTLALSGRLPGARFVPPLEASAQMLLVETHPLVKADLTGPERRVSPAEVGVATQYRGGRGFLLRGREGVAWTTSVVEALRTGDVVVQRADHGLYLSRHGGLLAETQLALENQGAPELSVTVPDPLFAGVEGRPVLLMPEKDGIRVPLDPGRQTVHVQHRAHVATFAGLLAARLPLLATPAETGRQHVLLALPPEWVPLFARFGTDRFWRLPGAPFFLWLALLAFCAERALAALVPPGRLRFGFALALGAAGMTSTGTFWALAGACVAAFALRLAARLPAGSVTFGRAAGISAALLLAFGVCLWHLETYEPRGGGGLGAMGSSGLWRTSLWQELRPRTIADAAPACAPPSATAPSPVYQRGSAPAQEAPPRASEYRGLPVRREMPSAEQGIALDQVAAERPRLFVLLVASGWVTAFRLALLALAAGLAVRHRALLLGGLRRVLGEAGAGLARAFAPRTADVRPGTEAG